MTSKRGISPDLFLWIFALVAGALLFLFFILWSGRHATTSTTVEDTTFLRTFEQQISSLSSTDELSKTITFPRPIGIHVDCTTLFTTQARETTPLFLFSPASLTGNKYTLVGKPWRFPFYADMFYYLIPEQNLVVLFYDPSAASFVTSLDIPSTLPVKSLPFSAYSLTTLKQQLQGYTFATLVFFGRAPDPTSLLASLKPLSVTVLEIDIDRSLLTFYPGDKEHFYLGEAMLFGAFFGQSQYACHSRRALERLQTLSTLYQQKVVLLQQKLGSGNTCQQLFSQGGSLLSSLSTTDDPEQLMPLVTSLTTVNEDLERHDCPQIY